MYIVNGLAYHREFLGKVSDATWDFRPENPHVDLGKVVVQDTTFYILDDPDLYNSLKKQFNTDVIPHQDAFELFDEGREGRMVEVFKAILGNTVEAVYQRSGIWKGHGHGIETVTVKNPDGSLVYEWSRVGRCFGPGYSCSYPHGPWVEYGTWQDNGSISADSSLREVVAKFLAREATFSDLRKALLAK